jgi:alginate O-acetyltransferase complex protein AlgI
MLRAAAWAASNGSRRYLPGRLTVQFNSYLFVAFFAAVLLFHYLPGLPWTARKAALVLFSYAFYAAWDPPFVLLLWLSTVVDFYMARLIANAARGPTRHMLLGVSLATNLGLLGYFKYGGFLLENFVAAMHAAGLDFSPSRPSIVLPAGISFYTFQTLSYTMDVYFRRERPCTKLLDFALFVAFFPQLVAGPIVRAAQFLPQTEARRAASGSQLAWGLVMLVLGIFEKTVLADGCFAPVADKVYSHARQGLTSADAWFGTLAFSGQIFCDFAGYSTSAIGAALCLGFMLPNNFLFPYAAVGFSDFWRRWHISLSSWLRDYLYIPLGGNRRGVLRTHVNLMVTMLIGGLWHGASWTFVAWGGLHGGYLIAERELKRRLQHQAIWSAPAMKPLLGGLTFLGVCTTWVFFRARSFGEAWSILAAMFGAGPAAAVRLVLPHDGWITLGATLLLVGGHWGLRDSTLEEHAERLPAAGRILALAGMLLLIITMTGKDRAFIYFQF